MKIKNFFKNKFLKKYFILKHCPHWSSTYDGYCPQLANILHHRPSSIPKAGTDRLGRKFSPGIAFRIEFSFALTACALLVLTLFQRQKRCLRNSRRATKHSWYKASLHSVLYHIMLSNNIIYKRCYAEFIE